MYELTATKGTRYVRVKRVGKSANKTAQLLRDDGWIVNLRALSAVGISVKIGAK